jgi:hypothetical protein
MSDELSFDRVVAGNAEMTIDQFMALPMAERIAHIIGKRVKFLRGKQLVDTARALQELRRQRAPS